MYSKNKDDISSFYKSMTNVQKTLVVLAFLLLTALAIGAFYLIYCSYQGLDLSYGDTTDKVIGWFFFLLFGGLTVFFYIGLNGLVLNRIGLSMAPLEHHEGIVVNKYYAPSRSSTGVGITTGGQMALTENYESEEYLVEIKFNDGKKLRLATNQSNYDGVDIGDKVNVYYKVSKFLGDVEWTGCIKKAQ